MAGDGFSARRLRQEDEPEQNRDATHRQAHHEPQDQRNGEPLRTRAPLCQFAQQATHAAPIQINAAEVRSLTHVEDPAGNLPGALRFAEKEGKKGFMDTYYGQIQPRLGVAYAVGAGFGALEYTAVFLALSLSYLFRTFRRAARA